ncbi:hypothetical protein U1Q18_016273 [Sarracenia purpurea var. burkii]
MFSSSVLRTEPSQSQALTLTINIVHTKTLICDPSPPRTLFTAMNPLAFRRRTRLPSTPKKAPPCPSIARQIYAIVPNKPSHCAPVATTSASL